jgi:hypothetical protein
VTGCQESLFCISIFVWTGTVRFEWNVEKDRINRRKHQISFTTATKVFDDPDYITEQDREVDGQERWPGAMADDRKSWRGSGPDGGAHHCG